MTLAIIALAAALAFHALVIAALVGAIDRHRHTLERLEVDLELRDAFLPPTPARR